MTQQGEVPKKETGNDIDDKSRVETTDDDDEDETGWTVVSYSRRNVRNNHQIEEPMTTGELTSQPDETTAEATKHPLHRQVHRTRQVAIQNMAKIHDSFKYRYY